MIGVSFALICNLAQTGIFLGWSFSAQFVDTPVHLFQGESAAQLSITFTLTNIGTKPKVLTSLVDAPRYGELQIQIVQPDGTNLRSQGGQYDVRIQGQSDEQLLSGRSAVSTLSLGTFGHTRLRQLGKHLVRAVYQSREGSLTVVIGQFSVVDIQPAWILSTHSVSNSKQSSQHTDELDTGIIQQIQVNNRVRAIYRRISGQQYGRTIILTTTLGEFTSRQKIEVSGFIDSNRPITIRYKDANSQGQFRRMDIDCIDGSVWVEPALKRLPGTAIPPPRPVLKP